MISPDTADTDSATESTETQCVPLAALQIDGTAPAVGDDVDYTVKGKIARIEGDCAYVTPNTINDQPAVSPTETPPADDMMAAAMKADGDPGA